MTWFGEVLSKLPPVKAAIGVILLSISGGVSLGVGGMAVAQEVYTIPPRTTALEVVTKKLGEAAETHYEEASRYFQQDSIATWQLRCMVEKMARDEEIDAFICDPTRR